MQVIGTVINIKLQSLTGIRTVKLYLIDLLQIMVIVLEEDKKNILCFCYSYGFICIYLCLNIHENVCFLYTYLQATIIHSYVPCKSTYTV